MGDPHNLQLVGLGRVPHENIARTTELEIVWIIHRWLVLAFIPCSGSNLAQNHEVFPGGISSTTCERSTQALNPLSPAKKATSHGIMTVLAAKEVR